MEQKATDFLNRKDLRQKLRRELLFGLFPKTLNGKFRTMKFSLLNVLAGHEQRHFVQNAFNVLVNEGFLRDQQGFQSLDVVQKFFEIIKEPMSKAKLVEKDLNSICPAGNFTLYRQAVIIMVQEDSQTNIEYYHAVRVSIIQFVAILYKTNGHHSKSHFERNKQGIDQVKTDYYR